MIVIEPLIAGPDHTAKVIARYLWGFGLGKDTALGKSANLECVEILHTACGKRLIDVFLSLKRFSQKQEDP